MAMDGIVGVILAGGQARRMGGRDKFAIELGGRRLIDIAVERLAGQVESLIVSANGDVGAGYVGLSVLPDASQYPLWRPPLPAPYLPTFPAGGADLHSMVFILPLHALGVCRRDAITLGSRRVKTMTDQMLCFLESWFVGCGGLLECRAFKGMEVERKFFAIGEVEKVSEWAARRSKRICEAVLCSLKSKMLIVPFEVWPGPLKSAGFILVILFSSWNSRASSGLSPGLINTSPTPDHTTCESLISIIIRLKTYRF